MTRNRNAIAECGNHVQWIVAKCHYAPNACLHYTLHYLFLEAMINLMCSLCVGTTAVLQDISDGLTFKRLVNQSHAGVVGLCGKI